MSVNTHAGISFLYRSNRIFNRSALKMSFVQNYFSISFTRGPEALAISEPTNGAIPTNPFAQSESTPFQQPAFIKLADQNVEFGAFSADSHNVKNVVGLLKNAPNVSYESQSTKNSNDLSNCAGALNFPTLRYPHNKNGAVPLSPLDTCFIPISKYFDQDRRINLDNSKSYVHPRFALLEACGQLKSIPIKCVFDNLSEIKKVGEGSFGEVYTGDFLNYSSNKFIYKIIPTGGKTLISGENQKDFKEVKQELVVARLLNTVRNLTGPNYTTAFCKLFRARLIHGKYPESLMTAWHKWHADNKSDWKVSNFKEDQHYLLLEFENVGKPLENFVFNNAKSAYFALLQVTFALAAAEQKLEFEHRDLHIGNILVKQTSKANETFSINGKEYKIPTLGCKASIIDFTFSRSRHNKLGTIFTDLGKHEEQFSGSGTGSYQFEIYRMMQRLNNNQWDVFVPKSNVCWLHYLVKKMVAGKDIKYKNINSQTHKKFIGKLEDYSQNIMSFDSASDYIQKTETEIYESGSRKVKILN